MNKFKGTFF